MRTVQQPQGVIVKRVSLATLALLVGAAACQDAVTSPQLAADLEYARASNPPPPPIDTGAIGSFSQAFLRAPLESPFRRPTYSIQQSSLLAPNATILGSPRRMAFDFVQHSFFFSVPVKYELNKKSDHGELHFKQIKHSDVIDVIKGCKVKFEHEMFSGKGMLEIQTEEGLLVIDCSSVNNGLSEFGHGCSEGDTDVCFNVVFDDVKFFPILGGGPIDGSVEIVPGCTPDIESEDCPFPPSED